MTEQREGTGVAESVRLRGAEAHFVMERSGSTRIEESLRLRGAEAQT